MRYGSRKFILSLLTLASADAMLFLGSITPSVWGGVVGSVLALYVAGNVGQKAAVGNSRDPS